MTAPSLAPPFFIAGEAVRPDRSTRTILSPSSGEPTTSLLLGTPEDIDAAVAAARRCQPELAKLDVDERVRRCERSAVAIEEKADEIADVLTRVHGKPRYSEAIDEVRGAAKAFREGGAAVRWMAETHYPLARPGKRLLTVRRPRGVYGIFTPWNFPVGIAAIYYLAPGLALGNAFVWIGAPTTAAAHQAMLEAIAPQWPEGAINVVTGDGPIVGQALAGHPDVDAIGFTGSTPGGLAVARTAAGKPMVLELGGNGPTIVLRDADVELAAQRIAGGALRNAGQVCTATGRVLAHESVATEVAEAIADHARKAVVGDPFDPQTTMGPVHLSELADKVLAQINSAVEYGATVVTGGRRADGPTTQYLEPSVVDHVPADAALHRDETFGPVAPIVHFTSEEQLWDLVQVSPFGLHAGIFTSDVERALGLAEKLRVGHVNINDTSAYWEKSIPAGGAAGASSGVGRTGVPASVLEMSELLTVTIESRGAPE